MRPAADPSLAVSRLLAAALLAAAALGGGCGVNAGEPTAAPWERGLRAMDDALARGDMSAAIRARHAAHLAALQAQRWEGLVAVGEASLRLADLADAREAMTAEARRAYLSALFRARQQQSLPGVLRATEAFALLGDKDLVRQGLAMAARVAAASGTDDAVEQVDAVRERLGHRRAMSRDAAPDARGSGAAAAGSAR